MAPELKNKESILLSKIYISFIILCTLPIYTIQKLFILVNLLIEKKYVILYQFSFFFHLFLESGILFLQIYLIVKLINPNKSRYKYTNLNLGFHPFFISNEGENIMYKYMISFLFLSISCFATSWNNLNNFLDFHIVLEFIGIIFSIYVIIDRYSSLNELPLYIMKFNRIRMLIKYEDYINYKIADDKPHIEVNQFLIVIKKEYPRTSEEKQTIEIRNFQTSGSPALVTKFNDSRLVKAIDEGHELKVRIFDIKEYGEIEIEMWLENINSQNC